VSRLAILLCLLSFHAASAAPLLMGTIVSSGASTNNRTTATPFTLPVGATSIQCSADVYVAFGSLATTAVTSSTGLKVPADVERVLVALQSKNVLAILPVSGSASCKVFQLAGETVSYRAGGGGGGAITTTDVQTVLLGQPLSVDTLTITAADNTADALFLNGGRIRAVPTTVSSGGYFYYSLTTNRWTFGHALENCGGCSLLTDSLLSQQGDRPVEISQSHGMRLTPQSTIGTCGSSPSAPEGTEKTLSAASVSGPSRRCYCSKNGSTYTWINLTCPAVAGDSTTCPACS
jgi:hypothetical protein